MSKKYLSFTGLRRSVSERFQQIADHRQASKVDISLHDAMMSGFACMHYQDPSLLQFQKRLEEQQNKNNLQTQFAVSNIPKTTQMREIIDNVDSEVFCGIFKDIYLHLQRGKYLEPYQILPKVYYFPIDGSQFYSSKEIHCEQCLTKTRGKGSPTYSHQVLQGGIMHPDCAQVIPFMPEQIVNSDGKSKQDCEMNAAKRFLSKVRRDFPKLGLLIGGDALFSKQPIIQDVLKLRMHYIFGVKPSSHQYLFDWLAGYEELHKLEFVDHKGQRHCYSWMNDVPLHGGKEAISVNFLQAEIFAKNKEGKEKRVYTNSWATDLSVTSENITTLVRAGRCRWKNENEVFNVMKNHGYCMERNYGHGKQHLAFNFYLLTLLAFFFHQIFEMTDKAYQACRKKFGSKKSLWETLRSYIRIIVFDSWETLLAFALKPTEYRLAAQQPP